MTPFAVELREFVRDTFKSPFLFPHIYTAKMPPSIRLGVLTFRRKSEGWCFMPSWLPIKQDHIRDYLLNNGEPESLIGPQNWLLRSQPAEQADWRTWGHLLWCSVTFYPIQDLWRCPQSSDPSSIDSHDALCLCQAHFYLRTFVLTIPSTWVRLPTESLLTRLTPSPLLCSKVTSSQWRLP